ncbi:MAG: acetyl-CoA carboxylase, carboxyltransferase subunit beta [Alphaproteobacteria bacterium]
MADGSNWLTSIRPRFRKVLGSEEKKDTSDDKWHTCKACSQMLYIRDLEAALMVCPGCGHHHRLGAEARLKSIFDGGKWRDIALPDVPTDPLKFRDSQKYIDRLKAARTKTGAKDAVKVGVGTLDDVPLTAAVQDFAFMGGSMGMATGEALVTAAETALAEKTPLIIFSASGGARMQEGILSLMQLPRTTVAIERLKEAGLPYLVVHTDPTTGGVTASYAMLGDVHIAEPQALIGFAGQRVIEQTIREKLPEGFQRAEYLLEHGMVDMVVSRHELRGTLSSILRHLLNRGPIPATA